MAQCQGTRAQTVTLFARCQGPRAQMIRLFFGLHLYLAKRVCKNPKVPGALSNVNLALSGQ